MQNIRGLMRALLTFCTCKNTLSIAQSCQVRLPASIPRCSRHFSDITSAPHTAPDQTRRSAALLSAGAARLHPSPCRGQVLDVPNHTGQADMLAMGDLGAATRRGSPGWRTCGLADKTFWIHAPVSKNFHEAHSSGPAWASLCKSARWAASRAPHRRAAPNAHTKLARRHSVSRPALTARRAARQQDSPRALGCRAPPARLR